MPPNARGVRNEPPRAGAGTLRALSQSAAPPRPPARPSSGPVEVSRIPGRAEDLVRRVDVVSELRRVRLAEQDRARGLQPLHGDRVLLGHVVLEDLRTERGAQPARV